MKPGDLVALNDVASSYVYGEVEEDVGDCSTYGVLISCRDYVFEEDPPHKSRREKVWEVLVENEVHDILEIDLTLKGSAQNKLNNQ